MSCFVCERIELIKKKKNPHFVYELETGYVVIGDFQQFYGYILFLYKEHVSELHQLAKSIKMKHLAEMALVYEAVYNAFKPEKMNCESLGNSHSHLHWHFFPRNAGDTPEKGPIWQIPRTELYADKNRPSLEEITILKEKLIVEIKKLLD